MYTVLRLGSRDPLVKELQQLLRQHYPNADLVVDGIFGRGTEQLVKQFQVDKRLVSDGVVGKSTWDALRSATGDIKYLTHEDYVNAAKTLQCDVAAIKAVAAVEASGGGFYDTGRPVVLFERHWMYRHLTSAHLPTLLSLAKAYRPDLVNPTAGGYLRGLDEERRFREAVGLHPEFAYASTSYGQFQIMGFHYQALGYVTAEAMYTAAHVASEQLTMFVKFIQQNKLLLSAIREKNWLQFASIYNGPQHHKNNYVGKMTDQYTYLSGLAENRA